jgi:two-component system, response regulator YesN
MLPSEIAHLTRLFHHATRLPIAIYDGQQCVLSLPESIKSAAGLLEGKAPFSILNPSPRQTVTAQYLNNDYQEQFIYFELDGGASLLCGPFTLKPSTDGDIQQLIRALKLPLNRREQFSVHVRSLPMLTEDNYFYAGKLLEKLFAGGEQSPAPSPVLLPDMGKPYFVKTYENRMAQFQHPPYFLEQEEVRLIRHGDRENALTVLSEINRLKRATLARDPMRSLKNSLICSCTLFTRAAIQGGVPADEAFTLSDTFIQTIEETQNLKSLDALEETMVLRFIDQVAGHNNASLSGMIRSAIAYIDHHLSEKLNVPMIARQIYVHPDYLSSRFKQEAGVTITAFMQKRRIEEACHFLRYSPSTVSEIAAFYQFCSQSHFIQVFKKYMGMTPAQYKNAM